MQPIYNIAEICAQKGIKEVILSPGSRCAPLTFAFTRHEDISTRTISDERSAAFIALGISQTTGKTSALVCTSGSAAYNYAPAIAEAFYSKIPLIIFTADRPDEWIDQLDGQTIRQQNIYGSHVKKSFHLPVDFSHPDAVWFLERSVNEAINLAQTQPQGPVHINVPLREPFYPSSEKPVSFNKAIKLIEIAEYKNILTTEQKESLQDSLDKYNKILVVAGQNNFNQEEKDSILEFCKNYKAILVGDIISNFEEDSFVVNKHDIILSNENNKISLQSDLLITFGKSVLSKTLKQFLRKYKAKEHWHIGQCIEVADTFQSLTKIIPVETVEFFSTFKDTKENKEYSNLWTSLNDKATSVTNFINENNTFNEFTATSLVMKALPDSVLLHLSNSMPVRYVNYLYRKNNIEVFCNRGTSGIDGVISTAMGAALATDKQVVVITGDMAFFYDRNAFWHNYLPENLRIVLLNNHGGGIFKMIDGPANEPEADEYFVTRQKSNAQYLAKEYNIEYSICRSYPELKIALATFFNPSSKPKIVEIETEISVNTDIFKSFKNKINELYGK